MAFLERSHLRGNHGRLAHLLPKAPRLGRSQRSRPRRNNSRQWQLASPPDALRPRSPQATTPRVPTWILRRFIGSIAAPRRNHGPITLVLGTVCSLQNRSIKSDSNRSVVYRNEQIWPTKRPKVQLEATFQSAHLTALLNEETPMLGYGLIGTLVVIVLVIWIVKSIF